MRKFYFGDPVRVTGNHYPKHEGHLGNIAATKIIRGPNKATRTIYSVDCACGRTLKTVANSLDFSQETSDVREKRLLHLFSTVGIPCPEKDALESEVDSLLSVLNQQYREIIEHRFGLTPGPQSYQGIADLMNVSKQRVHYATGQAIRRMKKRGDGKWAQKSDARGTRESATLPRQ